MPKKREFNICPRGHKIEGSNMRVRADRNGATECIACAAIGRQKFKDKKPLYDTWYTMIRRCSDPSHKDWPLYGGKIPPVTVCQRWLESYELFESDMGPKPSKSHMLDRIKGIQGYSPNNCKWSTPTESARNTATNRLISFDGRTMTLAEWAEVSGLKYMTLFMRLKRGWPTGKALGH